jgi:hypothetical protein
MRKRIIEAPDLYTRSHDVLYGVIEVLPQEADGLDLTKVTSFEKHVPAMRALCYNSPGMFNALHSIVKMLVQRRPKKEILLVTQKTIDAVTNSYKAYEPVQFLIGKKDK